MKNILLVSLLTASLFPLASCSSANGIDPSKPKEETKTSAPLATGALTIRQVITNAAAMHDQPVVLTGSFRGWKGCPDSAMLTRSDWVLEDDSGCIFVTGTLPAGVSPESAKGERIRVTGHVVLDAKGKPAIRAVRAVSLQ